MRTSGELVFVGHGIVAPEYNWNDYAGVDMKGKVALIMVNDPPATAGEPQLFGGPALTYYGRWTYKFEEAARQGAAGAILIHTDESATYGWQVVQSSWSGTQYSIPVVPGQPALGLRAWVTDRAAREIAKRAGQDLDALRKAALVRGAKPVPLGIEASATVVQKVQQKTSPNVIGVLEGTNPAAGRHLHGALRSPGHARSRSRASRPTRIAFSTARSTTPRAFRGRSKWRRRWRARAPGLRDRYTSCSRPRRSPGLLGSEYFAAHPVLPASAWAGNINIDSLNMTGPSRDIVLLGAERSTLGPLAAQLAAERGRVVGPDPAPGNGYFFRSDHFPLAKVGIPALSLSDPVEYTGADPAAQKAMKDRVREQAVPPG